MDRSGGATEKHPQGKAGEPTWTPDRWQRAGDLFESAAALPEAEREEFLAQAAPDDPALRRRVRKMLEAAGDGSDFLEEPLVGPFAEAAGGTGDDPDSARSGLEDPRLGQRLGPYRLLELLGQGGMGSVYRASREDGVHRSVALKVVRPGLGVEVARRFRSESALQARVEHPNVARLYDAGTDDDGTSYLVMEFVDGLPLLEACRQQHLDLEACVDLFLQVCDGVQAAHRSLMIHRDLKPANVLVTAEGVAKLLDFGVAKFFDPLGLDPRGSDLALTASGHRWMTPRYASPEQMRGQPLDTRSDVYSLGVILYELLTGKSPYGEAAADSRDLERAICEEPSPRPSEGSLDGSTAVSRGQAAGGEKSSKRQLSRWRARLRGDLDTIVLKALQKDRERRYASAEALGEDLRRWRQGLPILARPDSMTYRLGKFLRRHRTPVLISAVALVMVSVLAGFQLAERMDHMREIDRQRVQAEQASALLIDLLTMVEGAPSDGAGITTEALLDAGLRKMGAAESEDPLVRASVLHTIGKVFQQLGRVEEAEASLLQSLDLMQQPEEAEAEDTVDVLQDLGRVQRALGQFDAADASLQQVLAWRQEMGQRRPERLMAALFDLAALSLDRLDVERSADYFRQALSLGQRVSPSDPDAWLDALQSLIRLGGAPDLWNDALRLRREQLERRRELLGETHPDVARSLIHLGTLEGLVGNGRQAVALFEQAHDGLLKTLGPEHPLTISSRWRWAAALSEIGDYGAAEQVYRQTLEHIPRDVVETHSGVLLTLHNLGVVLSYQGAFTEADEILQNVLRRVDAGFPEDPCKAAPVRFSLGTSAHLQGRLDAAAEYFLAAEDVCEGQVQGRTHLPTDVALAYVRFDQGRGHEVCPGPLVRLEQETFPGAGSPSVEAEIQGLRGACQVLQGEVEVGRENMRAAQEILVMHRSDAHHVVRWLERRLQEVPRREPLGISDAVGAGAPASR